MKRVTLCSLLTLVAFNYGTSPAWALKAFGDAWNKFYVNESENEEFKKLAGEAKCNVCHKGKTKKERNPYGTELHELLKKKDFPDKRLKDEPEKVKEEIEAAFKKVEEKKAADGKTYGEKIKEGMLPGGEVEGK